MDFSRFQFAQPVWLWALLVIPLLGLLYALFYKTERGKLLERFADRHLLPHLVKAPKRTASGLRLSLLLWAAAWLCGVVAMAGPRWNYTDVPTFRQTEDLVIVLDLSQSMNATDVAPSRIARAREEIQDLLDLSRGASIGLVAYAAVPHMVTPLTDDVRTIKYILPALDTSLVTIQGDRLKPALAMAANMLKAEPGDNKSILVISDGDFEEEDFSDLVKAAGGATLYSMGIGGAAPAATFAGAKTGAFPFNTGKLQRLASAGHGIYVLANYTDSDTRAILGAIGAASVKAQTSFDGARVWDERFYLPALALALLLLPLFRRGARFPIILLLAIAWFAPVPSRAATIADLFLNRDQQAQAAYERGDYKAAVGEFSTPYRRGVAAYREGAYDKAAVLFKAAAREKGNLNALYDLGNAQLMQGQVQDAIASYEAVLKQQPGHVGARHNLAIALEMARKQPPDKQPKNQNKKQDKKQGGGKQGQGKQDQGKQDQGKQDQGKQGHGQQGQGQQAKDAQHDSQNRQKDAQDPASAKQQQAQSAQQRQQQQRQQAASRASAPPSQKPAQAAAAGQNQTIAASARMPPRTQKDRNADEWFARVQTDPGSFLRNQFMLEERESGLK